MMYNMKYFNENAIKIESKYALIYDLDEHRIAIAPCDRCARKQYYNVCVDGETIATRALMSNTLRIALNHLNNQ